jgi:hypothetical protein
MAMHNAAFFGLKRAYYATLGLTRRTLHKMGLTALAWTCSTSSTRRSAARHRKARLWRTLGVVPSVVSRMLKRLEET